MPGSPMIPLGAEWDALRVLLARYTPEDHEDRLWVPRTRRLRLAWRPMSSSPGHCRVRAARGLFARGAHAR
jgi:hypothetical protein